MNCPVCGKPKEEHRYGIFCCGHCGSDKIEINDHSKQGTLSYVQCWHCGIKTTYRGSPEKAKEIWNRRATGWISVKDRLPEHDTIVIVKVKIIDNGKERIYKESAWYVEKRKEEIGSWDSYENGDWFDYDEENDIYYLPGGFYEYNQHEKTHWFIEDEVIEWQYLPEN